MLEATDVEMEQWYWAGIDDSLADGIQFVEDHTGLTESTKGSPERHAKKRARFSRVLDTQIRIPVLHPPTSPARSFSPHPSVADSLARSSSLPHPVADSVARSPSPPPPPPPVADSRSPHRLPPSPPPPPPPIQVIKLSN